MTIRDATPADAAAIAAIYNHAVIHTTAIWNDTLALVDDRADWIRERQALGFAVLVSEEDGVVNGFAAFGPFRPQEGYAATVEHSVYVAPGQQRRGAGRSLLAALIAKAREQGRHAMIGAIEARNFGSLKLHYALGFRDVGRLPEVGQKFGQWLDLALVQLTLDSRSAP